MWEELIFNYRKYLLLKLLIIVLIQLSQNAFCEDKKQYQNKDGKSLTQKYIDSLRQGKWGITDPDWVNISNAQFFFSYC